LAQHAGAVSTGLAGGVQVSRITDDPKPVARMSDPGNPSADKDGYVYLSNVNEMTEMVEMMAASRSYQNNVEVINTARQLMARTLDIIKS
jgi:flagellar basal-body rod protein FlgC